jgi:serine/threonine protein kinase
MSQPFSDKTTVAAPADHPRAERLAAALDRYMRELENGGIPPDLDALVAEHPDLAEELRSYVDSLKLLHQMTAGMRAMPTRAEPAIEGMATKRLGDYDILREIGRGGMGIVYEARQLSLNRQVALKVLPFAAMMDEKQIARFRNEAQAAAQLHHPNIVPVHAVGQERGVHFFAMQYVPGQSLEMALQELRQETAAAAIGDGTPRVASPAAGSGLTAHTVGQASGGVGAREFGERETETFAAYSTKASTRSRGYCQSVARLMIQAADAIQHAHEYGVIHRDVKPSNLLLDRSGKLWVTDFGLARMQSDSGVTMTGDVVGTLRYMSPEQAAGATAMVDARADVYSLGATLYELLTLRPPHAGDNRQSMLRQIETREPTPPRAINASIPLDLETITLRAMAKSREERYPSAKALASDLRAFLEGRPTVAQRPTALDRAAKWALRHRRAVSVAAGVLLVLAVVSVSAAVMIAREKSRTDEALESARAGLDKAEASDKRAREVVDTLGSRMAGELAAVPGLEALRGRLLGETLAYYRQFIAQSADDPRLQGDLAAAYFKAAAVADSLGDRREAIHLCQQALAEFDELLRQSPDNGTAALERSKCRSSLGLFLAKASEVDAALDAYTAAIAEQDALVRRPNIDPAVVRALADTHSNRGLLLAELGRKSAARRSLQTAIGLVERLAARAPDDARLQHDLAISYNSLSFVERDLDWARAEKASRRSIELLEKLAAAEPNAGAYRADLALCENNLGAILAHSGDWAGAGEAYRGAIAVQEQLQRHAPAVVSYRRELAVSWNNLGQSQEALGQAADAAESYDAAQKIIGVLVGDYPEELSFRSLCGAVHNNRAMALETAGDNAAALAEYELAVQQQRVAYDRAPQVAEYREFLSKHYYNFGRALRAANDPARAADAARARRELWAGDGEHLGQVAVELAETALRARDLDGAEHAELADRCEADVAVTLRDAAASGLDLASLRGVTAFQLLHDSTIWTMITTSRISAAD